MGTGTTSRNEHLSTAAADPAGRTLAGEHAVLLRDVQRRVAPVLALARVNRWPAAELDTVVRFMRTTVLRQASDEEAQLYPTGTTAAPFAELSADHVRLHALTDRLQEMADGPGSLPELCAVLDELCTVLERHLRDEQAVLATLAELPVEVPGAADVAAGTQAWLPRGHEPVLIMLDALPAQLAVQLCIERVLRLHPGESAEIYSSDAGERERVRAWMRRFDAARYGCSDIGRRGLRITRRS